MATLVLRAVAWLEGGAVGPKPAAAGMVGNGPASSTGLMVVPVGIIVVPVGDIVVACADAGGGAVVVWAVAVGEPGLSEGETAGTERASISSLVSLHTISKNATCSASAASPAMEPNILI